MRTAVALSYDPAVDEAPQVVSTGRCELAREMERVARRYGVPIIEDGALAERLVRVPAQHSIPVELYFDVATLLVRC